MLLLSFFRSFISFLVVPLAGYHSQVRASYRTEVYDLVVAAVDVREGLVERYVKHCQLVVVAEKSLEESLVREIQLSEVVVRAVYENQVRAVAYIKSCEVVVGAYEVLQHVAVLKSQSNHVVV